MGTFLSSAKVKHIPKTSGKLSTLVSKNGGKTPITPSGKFNGKMLAARKVKAPKNVSYWDGYTNTFVGISVGGNYW